MSDETEQVQSVGMIRLSRQDPSITSLGLGQAPGLMMLKAVP